MRKREALGEGILDQQDPDDGSYWHILTGDFEKLEQFRTVYYDGECTFGLTRLYSLTGEQKWLDAACRAMPKTKEEREEEEAEARALGLKKPFRAKRRAVLSLNGFMESMGPLADHLSCFADPTTVHGVEGELGLCESPLIDALREAIEALSPDAVASAQLLLLHTDTALRYLEGDVTSSTGSSVGTRVETRSAACKTLDSFIARTPMEGLTAMEGARELGYVARLTHELTGHQIYYKSITKRIFHL